MDSRKISRFFVYFFLTVGALIMLLPFFWMFLPRLKPRRRSTVFRLSGCPAI